MESLARVLVGLLLIVLLLNLGRGGWPAVRQWISAKFVGTAAA